MVQSQYEQPALGLISESMPNSVYGPVNPSPIPSCNLSFLSKIMAKVVASGSYRASNMTSRNAHLASCLFMHGQTEPNEGCGNGVFGRSGKAQLEVRGTELSGTFPDKCASCFFGVWHSHQ